MKQKNCSLKNESQKYKTDKFTLHQEGANRWKVSGRDLTGSYRRIRFEANDLTEAVVQAETLLTSTQDTNGDSVVAAKQVCIGDAVFMAIKEKNWTDYTRKQEYQFCKYFLQWTDMQGLVYWSELRFEHLQAYYRYLLQKKMSYDGVRLYLIPVRRTAAWMASNWPRLYVNFGQSFRLSKTDFGTTTYCDNTGNPFLSIKEGLDFLTVLEGRKQKDLAVGVALQALVGLQLQEALRLTWDKVNLEEGTITIEGVVKNPFRVRRIPIPRLVKEMLSSHKKTNSGEADAVVQSYASFVNYSHALSRELKRWKPNLKLKPKDLRNTLQTTAIDNGWYGFYVQRYVGHAPTTVGERHYHGNQGWRLIPLYQKEVVDRVEQIIASWKNETPHSDRPCITTREGLHDDCTIASINTTSADSISCVSVED